jgi:hypothetical protein
MKHVYVNSNEKVFSLVRIITEMMEWHAETDVQLFEEIKPTMVVILPLDQTFTVQEIINGDIIWFTKASENGFKVNRTT